MKYVWLNLQTGEFSNSFTIGHHDSYFKTVEEALAITTCKESLKAGNWKLIRFNCANDPDFEFSHYMKLR